MNPLLESHGIHFSYGNLPVLRGVSLSLAAGTVTGIIGPNGAGKSTLIRILAGSLAPASGNVLLDGAALPSIPARQRAQRIAVVPQESHIPFPFTALEVVLMGRAPYLPRFGFESRRDLEIARAAMEATDSSHLAARDIAQLSGGERRRVIIARALAQEPAILLLDEPTSFLDLRHSADLVRILRCRARETGLAVAAVMHDLNLAAASCDRIALLHDGRVEAIGTPHEVIAQEVIRASFGIEVHIGTDAATGLPYCIPLHGLQSSPSA